MTGIYTITLNGKPERIRFNQYARAELSKHLVPKDKISVDEIELTRIIIDKANENLPALIKLIVYAGVLGDSLITGFQSRLSIEEVGEFVGDAPNEELYAIWKAFLNSQSIKGKEEEGEKKK